MVPEKVKRFSYEELEKMNRAEREKARAFEEEQMNRPPTYHQKNSKGRFRFLTLDLPQIPIFKGNHCMLLAFGLSRSDNENIEPRASIIDGHGEKFIPRVSMDELLKKFDFVSETHKLNGEIRKHR